MSQTCQPGEHTFSRSRDTNEPVGRCISCEVSPQWAEQQEQDEPVAFADVPASEVDAYIEALFAESVALNR